MEICYKCKEACDEVYRIKIINEQGEMSFENICSVECGEQLQSELISLHRSRANEMQEQIFQRVK